MMKEIVNRVISNEQAAGRFYEKAAVFFKDDPEIADFLKGLAEDEKKHHELVSTAFGASKGISKPAAGVSVDRGFVKEIESRLWVCEKKLEAGDLSKDDLITSIVAVEYSECNEIFLYAITVLKEFPSEFLKAIDEIKRHKERIEKFIETHPEYHKFLDIVRSIPEADRERILVVDDEAALIDIFEVFLSQVGVVESAFNGVEALEKISKKPFFSVILTDVDMPVMDGMELYKRASEIYPELKDRFIFLTGSFDEGRASFFKENNLRYLMKPVSIKEIKKAVSEIIKR